MENKSEQITTSEPIPTQTQKEEVKKEDVGKSKKQEKQKKTRRPFKVVMKTWSKGLSKEAGRIAWEKRIQVIKDFVVILAVSVILAALFFGIDMIIITIRK